MTSRLRPAVGLATTTLSVLLLAGCSPGGSDEGGDAIAGAMSEAEPQGPQPAERRAAGPGQASDAAGRIDVDAERVISHGTVSLAADDVGRARAEVQRIADTYAGQVAESETQTDDAGRIVRARLVLRVPVADFDEAMDSLEQVADLRSSDQASDVVTAQYTDLQARVRAQEKSLERVELLFTRAQSIQDIMAIESQLTSRQAELDSLKGQLRVLEDRTDLSTIAVHVERTVAEDERDEDRAGFLVGLEAGWGAFTGAAVAVATVAGALVPFVLALGLLAALLWLPARLAMRSLRRHRPPADRALPEP